LGKRSNGERVGNIAYGYRLSSDRAHLEPDEAEQAVVVRIATLRRAHKTLREIARDLNQGGCRTRRGSEWRHEYVKRIADATSAARVQ
jgi:hypothetical protein